MSHKFIPYPCDYKNAASVRRAHRGGNIFVIVLCGVIALLLGAGAFFALTNEGQAWETVKDLGERVYVEPGRIGVRTDSSEPDAVSDAKDPASETKQETAPEQGGQNRTSDDMSAGFGGIPDVVDEVSPGVVGILNYQKGKSKKDDLSLAGSGSGFVYKADGFILTNHHVVEGADQLKVSLQNGEVYEAKLIGGDIMSDVAVLKIEANGLKALPMGDSDKARVGEFVLAIGDPISADELSGSVTFGIVSALSRKINIEGFENEYLQTDAAVNPGNSGGPLINMRGEVIGVTSAKYTTAGYDELGQSISSEGIGFALPINNVIEIAELLIKDGSISRPGIGITVVSYDEESGKTPGVYIYGVSEGGPAEKAGAKVGDRLISLDGKEYKTQDEFVAAIRSKKAGDTMKLVVDRNGEQVELTIIIGDLNQIHK